MNKIIPRWEWRTFGDKFEDAENKIKKQGNGRHRQRSEIYILSQKSNDNTKIREGLMDIKSPIRINEETGLEQWTVVTKADFPIHINDLVVVYKAFGIPMPYLEKDQYSYSEYLNELIKPNSHLKIVDVHKNRHGYIIDDAIVEIAEVKFDEYETKTIAVEHANPDLVLETMKKLELTDYENINYIKAMKTQFGMEY